MTGPVVVLNPAAGGGRAASRWPALAPLIAERTGPFAATLSGSPEQVASGIREWAGRGVTCFLAAGGDGGVNLLVTALASLGDSLPLERFRIGAAGLGSSNDFHKPIRPEARCLGVPCRVDFAAAVPWDVCVLDYREPAGPERRRFWIINASIGTTAEGNWLFNNPTPLMRRLKATRRGLAKAYAAFHALVRFRELACTLSTDGSAPVPVRVRNLAIVKSPYVSGWLHFDSPHEPSSGRFWVHHLEPVPIGRLLLTLWRLARGKFQGQRGTHSWPATRLAVASATPFVTEVDGEVVQADRAAFSVLPHRLGVCP